MKKRVILLCMILAFIAGASIVFIINAKSKSGSGALTARIYKNNELLKEIDLSTVTEAYTFTIENGNEKNVIEVRPGSIGIIEASCPDRLCVKMGFISDSLMPVTCLPNKVVIRVDGRKNEIDGVAR